MRIRIWKSSTIFLLVLILGMGLALRFYNLNRYSLWYDEALSVLQVHNMSQITPKDFTPPIYTLFMKFWMHITDSEFGLRLPSAIFSLISVLMMFIVGRLLFANKIGLISSFLTAISPFQIYYSQEARMYSLITMLTLFSVYFFIKSLKNGATYFWIGFVITTLLNIYCHYIGVFFWLAEIVFIAVIFKELDRNIIKRCMMSNMLIFISSFFWLVLSCSALNMIQNNAFIYRYFWAPSVSLKSLFLTLKVFSAGYHATKMVYLPAIAIFVFFFLKGISKFRKGKGLMLSLLCFMLPIVCIFSISKFKSVYVDRYFISSALFYYLIVACGLASLDNKKMILSLSFITFLSGAVLMNYYSNNLPYSDKEHIWIQRKKDHKGIVQYINKNFKEGDVVYHTCRNTVYPFIYYANRLNDRIAKLKDKNICLSIAPQNTVRLIFSKIDNYERYYDESNDYSLQHKKRFWLILSSFEFEIVQESPQDMALLEQLNRNFRIIKSKKFKGAKVFLYEKR